MKIAVISDIHANLEAFTAVLEEIDRTGVDDIICLGDAVGYGPDPDAVVRLLGDRGIVSVVGNHDLAAVEPHYLQWFNPPARFSLRYSIAELSPPAVALLRSLSRSMVRHSARFVHGFPPASPFLYQFAVPANRITAVFREAGEHICFTGHTHELEIITWDGFTWSRTPLKKGTTRLSAGRKYIVNIGSVGQPRDGDNNAKYVVWMPDRHLLELRFVPYDIEAVVKKIIAAGLPAAHAYRLR
jgi:predicted phosphodiesterase